ncbi:hypothetical protein E4T56_gene1983 [Termitomyces sp. T112]|nr:hypothetical protein E4T56_gene1983 [Termitomyces sp. T112]
MQPSESTPLVSHSRRLKSYTNNLPCSPKRRQRLATLLRRLDTLDVTGTIEEPSDDSTLGSVVGQNASPTWQPSCKPSQPDSLRSPLPQSNENYLSSISLILENHGSVARDHLASERTFLAYVRTSLSIASSGVALVQLFTLASSNLQHYRLLPYIRPLGAFTIILGLIVLLIGVVRYFSVQAALTKGYFPVARVATGFITLVLSSLVIVTFAILVARR